MTPGDLGADLTGRLLAGRYRVTGQLGRGGMGVVCRAVDEVLGREVAVKVLRAFTDASATELADLRTRMQREARAAARIRHSGVITVHDVADEAGLPVIVMELIDGPSLDDLIDERGVIDPHEAAAIGAQVADALDAGHRAGVLHRDVKPGNVLLDRGGPGYRTGRSGTGRVVLTDFGIASMDTPDDATTKLTRSGELIGSLDYLAPERAQGHQPGPASDIWALGMTLYAAVEGSSPFRRTSVWSTLTAIVSDPLPEPRRAGPLSGVLRALMAKDPASRPTADQARDLLETVAAGGVPVFPVPGAGHPPTAPDVRGAAVPPPGFGPPPDEQPPAAAPYAPGPYDADRAGQAGLGADPDRAGRSHTVRSVTEPLVGGRSRRSPGRGRGRNVVLAAVAAVVLVGGGLAYALIGSGDGDTEAGGSASPAASASRGGAKPADNAGKDGAKKRRTAAPSASHSPKRPKHTKDPKGTKNNGKDGKDTPGTASGKPAPPPACRHRADGAFDCGVWARAASYTQDGVRVGAVNKGTNYFYCQADLGRRETNGRWTNVWWARTDDDNGNTDVYVSAVYLKGGDNDQPLPGLPVC